MKAILKDISFWNNFLVRVVETNNNNPQKDFNLFVHEWD